MTQLRNFAHAAVAVVALILAAQGAVVAATTQVLQAFGVVGSPLAAHVTAAEGALFTVCGAVVVVSKWIDSLHNKAVLTALVQAVATPGITQDAVNLLSAQIHNIAGTTGKITAP